MLLTNTAPGDWAAVIGWVSSALQMNIKYKEGKGMNKQKKRLAAMGMAAAMTATLLSGCGGKTKATPENLLKDMTDNAGAIESVLMKLDLQMRMESAGEELGIGMTMDIESTVEPEMSYAKGDLSLEMSGSSLSTEMEMYSEKEGDQYVTYTLMENEWTKEIADETKTLGEVDRMTGDIEEYADRFKLEEDLVDVEGKECFELTGELDGEMFSEMLQSNMMDSFSGYGLSEDVVSDMVFPCDIDIYRDSILPARISFDLTDTFDTMMADSGVTAQECYMEIVFTEYDSIEEIVIPDEALEAAEDSSGLLDDFGDDTSSVTPAVQVEPGEGLGESWESYTVQINDTVVTLPCTMADLEAAGVALDTDYTPENYVVNAGEYELVWFMNENGSEIMVTMYNTTDSAIEVKDCLVGRITVDSYDLEDGGLTVIFPGGIQIGSAEADVLAAYGEPDDTYEDPEYGNSYDWYDGDSYSKGCSIDIEAGSGLVESMEMESLE